MVALRNVDSVQRQIEHGDKPVQMSIMPSPQADFFEVNKLTDTERGDGGFGSTDE